ncbi:MAG TPA: GspH/FimT family pseudopilin [Rubrivivax sp.]|nr:GspH/FimT family pseudopilin [Rubrivivax sp.]
MHAPIRLRARGFTIIELMVVIALVGVLIALVAPSLRGMVSAQRVRGVNAELVTDLQYARSEAARRNRDVRVAFRAASSLTCYVLYVQADGLPVEDPELVNGGGAKCDCGRSGAPGDPVCISEPGREEIKTVRVPRSSGVTLGVTSDDGPILAFGRTAGRLVPLSAAGTPPDAFVVLVAGDPRGQLQTTVNEAGRPSVCSPDDSISGVSSTC